jgi:ribosomal protein L11 methyltransferase
VQQIAPRVVVYPYGTAPPPVEEGWLALPLVPQSAPSRHAVFGDGSHATTRLCAGAVDLLCRQRPGVAVLDVGTGTGILARIARSRGASFVVGTDIDPAAIACAQTHAGLDEIGSPSALTTNPAGARSTAVADGSLGAGIHLGAEAPDHWGSIFDVVVANILEAPLHALAPALRRALAPGGVLLLSGFTRPQAPALRRAYESAGLQPAGDFTLDDWVLLKFTLHGR